jgi:hypothetical protein
MGRVRGAVPLGICGRSHRHLCWPSASATRTLFIGLHLGVSPVFIVFVLRSRDWQRERSGAGSALSSARLARVAAVSAGLGAPRSRYTRGICDCELLFCGCPSSSPSNRCDANRCSSDVPGVHVFGALADVLCAPFAVFHIRSGKHHPCECAACCRGLTGRCSRRTHRALSSTS